MFIKPTLPCPGAYPEMKRRPKQSPDFGMTAGPLLGSSTKKYFRSWSIIKKTLEGLFSEMVQETDRKTYY
jgi:hypothetical protein